MAHLRLVFRKKLSILTKFYFLGVVMSLHMIDKWIRRQSFANVNGPVMSMMRFFSL